MQPIKKQNLKPIHSVTSKVKRQSKQAASMVKIHENIILAYILVI